MFLSLDFYFKDGVFEKNELIVIFIERDIDGILFKFIVLNYFECLFYIFCNFIY